MNSTRRRTTGIVRRASLARGVLTAAVGYVADDATDLTPKDWVVLPVVVALYLAMAVFAPDALSQRSFLGASPHGPAGSK